LCISPDNSFNCHFNYVNTHILILELCNNIMPNERVLTRNGSRILTPKQHYDLRMNLDQNSKYPLIIDGLLNTGCRVVEFWKIVQNPQWYHPSRKIIDLPKEGACKKPECKTTDRTIRLSDKGVKTMDLIYGAGIEYRDPASIQQALKRAAKRYGFESVDGINSKMYRKMLVSWLVECRKDLGIDVLDIRLSMGHTKDTMVEDYLGCAFNEQEHLDMLMYLKGWGK
jgi:integrase